MLRKSLNISEGDRCCSPSDEFGSGRQEFYQSLGDGDTGPDAVIQGSQALLRAERSANGYIATPIKERESRSRD